MISCQLGICSAALADKRARTTDAARTEVLRDGTVSGEEPLGVTRRLEPLHAPLALTSRLMRVLRAVIEIAMLAMFHPWQDLALGGSVALEFIGDDHARDVG